jgi:hypothetical protein
MAMQTNPTVGASSAPLTPAVPSKPQWDDWLAFYDEPAENVKFRALAYGEPGAGKTHFLGSWPKVLIIDTDAGGLTLRKSEFRTRHIASVPCLESRGIIKLVFSILDEALAKRGVFADGAFETIALDSITAFSNAALTDLMLQANKDPLAIKPSYDEYGKLLNVGLELGKRLKRLSLTYNVVVTALPKLDKDDLTGEMTGGPNLVGGYRDLIGADFDELYFLADEGAREKSQHVLYTARYRFYPAKTRLGLPYRIVDPTYAILAEALK